MLTTIAKIFLTICAALTNLGYILGAVAFLFNIAKIYRFIVSFYWMPKAHFKALLLRFDLSIDEMKLIDEFLNTDIASFIDFITPKTGRRIEEHNGAMLRLPTVAEQTALIALRNRGLLMTDYPVCESGTTDAALNRDMALADCITTSLFAQTFRSIL
jgi:hypothetical protein